MRKIRWLIVCLMVLTIKPLSVHGLFQWILGTGKSDAQIDDSPLSEVSFELAPSDEKFLAEVKKLALEESNDSALGNCHHRLVLSLKQTCTELSQEEIGKVAVNLLNCQNAIEKRRQFPCTPSMSLADCTRDMDSPSWTVYQLMANRALAVCHSVGQQLFRFRTELIVNRLAQASEQQVGQLRDMHTWHDKLRTLQAMADARMTSLASQHDAMVTGQETLLQRQRLLEQALDDNAQHLRQEKAQLEGGTQDLLSLTGEVKARLDATVHEVQRQEELLTRQREEMYNTVKHYEDSLGTLLATLETKGEGILVAQEETFARVQASFEGIQRVNDSLGAIGTRLLTIQEDVSTYIEWVHECILGRSELLWIGVTHMILLVVLMGLAAFLHVAIFSRVIIIIAVPTNFYLTFTSGIHASPVEILLAITTICVVDVFVWRIRSTKLKKPSLSNDEVRQLINSLKSMEKRIEDLKADSQPRNSSFNVPDSGLSATQASINWITPIRPNLPEWDRISLAASDVSGVSTLNSQLNSTSSKQRCQGSNRNGSRCKRLSSSLHCSTHRKSAGVVSPVPK